jgi:flavin reductase (DIM6/NTAB) family NADH-FMN oxidoreductase RutF
MNGTIDADKDGFRSLMSAFPTGVAVVTTLDTDGRPRGLTCSALTSVTVDPPTLLVCLTLRSGTRAAMEARGRFAVNLLHSRARSVAVLFSSPVADRFSRVRWRSSEEEGSPCLVEDAFAYAECSVAGTMAVGDHAIVLGEVKQVAVSADVPLLYGLREFAAWRPGSGRSAGEGS